VRVGYGKRSGVAILSLVKDSVADPDPGSGAFLTPGSEIRDPEKTYSGFLRAF
jgi:hypothetical protein